MYPDRLSCAQSGNLHILPQKLGVLDLSIFNINLAQLILRSLKHGETFMVISGIFLKANQARIVTITGSKKSHKLVAPKVNKLSLPKNPTKDDVDVFSQAFKAYCADNSVDKVFVNRRATSGQGAGGAGTFIIEGILLAVSPVPIEFVHSATVRATDKREGDNKTSKPQTVDLGKAYDFGYEGLS